MYHTVEQLRKEYPGYHFSGRNYISNKVPDNLSHLLIPNVVYPHRDEDTLYFGYPTSFKELGTVFKNINTEWNFTVGMIHTLCSVPNILKVSASSIYSSKMGFGLLPNAFTFGRESTDICLFESLRSILSEFRKKRGEIMIKSALMFELMELERAAEQCMCCNDMRIVCERLNPSLAPPKPALFTLSEAEREVIVNNLGVLPIEKTGKMMQIIAEDPESGLLDPEADDLTIDFDGFEYDTMKKLQSLAEEIDFEMLDNFGEGNNPDIVLCDTDRGRIYNLVAIYDSPELLEFEQVLENVEHLCETIWFHESYIQDWIDCDYDFEPYECSRVALEMCLKSGTNAYIVRNIEIFPLDMRIRTMQYGTYSYDLIYAIKLATKDQQFLAFLNTLNGSKIKRRRT